MTTTESIVFGLSHIALPVRDLEVAARLYRDALGFAERGRCDEWLELDAGGTVALRLVGSARPDARASLRIQSPTIEATRAALIAAGCTAVGELARTPDQELTATVRDPDGHLLELWRPLSEDEYDVAPPLPTELTWTPDAEALLQALLKRVPALFRGLARRRVVRVAEELAERTKLVTREEVIRGYILASPRVTRERNRQPLIDLGIDVERYAADWRAD